MPTRRNQSIQVRRPDDQLWLDFDRQPLQLMSPDEIFEKADESLLLSLKEDRRIERKPPRFGGDSLGENFSMWANTAPDGGLICSGQHDKDGFYGCKSLSPKALNQLEKTGYVFAPDAKCEPPRRIPVTNLDGEPDFIVLFRVKYHRDIVVRTSGGKVFIREGDSKVELKTPEEIRELQADKGEISFERQPCGLVWPHEFDTAAAGKFVEAVRKARKLSDALTREEVLEVRHLGELRDGRFEPNIACAMLFAIDPLKIIPGCKIRFQRFEGEAEGVGEKYNAVKDEILEGTAPILEVLSKVVFG